MLLREYILVPHWRLLWHWGISRYTFYQAVIIAGYRREILNAGNVLRNRYSRRADRMAVPDTGVPCAEEQSWTMRHWNFGIVRNVKEIMNIVRSICLPINMSKSMFDIN